MNPEFSEPDFPLPLLNGQRPRICLLSMSPIADDPRVRRQGDAFHAAGWQVFAVGLPGGQSPLPSWTVLTPEILDLPEAGRPAGLHRRQMQASAALPVSNIKGIERFFRVLLPGLGRSAVNSIVRPVLKPAYGDEMMRRVGLLEHYWQHFLLRFFPNHFPHVYFSDYNCRRFYETARLVDADIIIANDWHTLPVAMLCAQEQGIPFGYDSHEYALEEYGHSWKWRLVRRPFTRAVEAAGVRQAAVISCVSTPIAAGIQQAYGLEQTPLVIRNAAHYVDIPAAPCHRPITVLYHGIIVPTRGIEDSIISVKDWRPEFRYHLRGPVSEGFRTELSGLINRYGLHDRVAILPPVPMVDLIHAAADADIGLSSAPFLNRHNGAALPNKFFEYIQAGLALIVPATADMEQLVTAHDLGLALRDVSARVIAEAVNSLTPEAVTRYKANARRAAKFLNWEYESRILITAYAAALQLPVSTKFETAA